MPTYCSTNSLVYKFCLVYKCLPRPDIWWALSTLLGVFYWWALTYKTNETLSSTIWWHGGQKKKEMGGTTVKRLNRLHTCNMWTVFRSKLEQFALLYNGVCLYSRIHANLKWTLTQLTNILYAVFLPNKRGRLEVSSLNGGQNNGREHFLVQFNTMNLLKSIICTSWFSG